MSEDSEDRSWREAMKLKGHMPILDEDGDLDVFHVSFDIHNGPGCSACGWGDCMHCTRVEDIPECTVLTISCVEIRGQITHDKG